MVPALPPFHGAAAPPPDSVAAFGWALGTVTLEAIALVIILAGAYTLARAVVRWRR